MHIHTNADLKGLIRRIGDLLETVRKKEAACRHVWESVQPHYRDSARNLIHYLAMRAYDLRDLQEELSMLSVSSLGHSEGYTLQNLQNILNLIKLIDGQTPDPKDLVFDTPFNFRKGREQLHRNSEALFGKTPPGGNLSKIMVTMPNEAADDYRLILSLLRAGMNIARINTGHDSPREWRGIIENIRKGERETGRPCLIYMDLSGPKLRTLAIDPGHKIRDKHGGYINLYPGNQLKVYRYMPDPFPVPLAWAAAENEETIGPAGVSTTLPQIMDDVRVGERIFFDDGQVGGVISAIEEDTFLVDINQAGIKGAKLRVDKGINLPDTTLRLPSLTEEDYTNLPFIAEHADIVGYSFVRRPEDVELLQAELKRLGRPDMGLVLKIETKSSFENLPMLLLTAMRSPKVGVMIARGDLAVEVGFERIAEVQEEILWLCEAAHLPGIWATQVLEKLAKKGLATRAEITDAAMSARAECVMLNKGPYIDNAVATLHDIIHRMEKHQFKRKSNLRPLSVAARFLEGRTMELSKG